MICGGAAAEGREGIVMRTRNAPVLGLVLAGFVLSLGLILAQAPARAEDPPQPDPEPPQPEEQAPVDPEAPIIEYCRDPDTIVVMMRGEHGGEVEDWDPTPLLRIYGDGRVAVKGRNREVLSAPQLSEEEMSRLLLSLAEKGVMDFDDEAVNRELDRIDLARGLPWERRYSVRAPRVMVDGSAIIIEISLDGYKPIGADQGVKRPFKKRIHRFDITGGAKNYPEVKAVTGLAAAYLELYAIVHDTISKRYRREK